jgi:hypothetical protein
MKKLIKLIAVIVSVALFLPSCTEKPETHTYTYVDTNVQVSTAVINLGVNDVSPVTLQVTATEGRPYWISNKPAWVTATLNPGTGNTAKGNSTLTISVTSNDGLLPAREGKIAISSETAGGKVEIVAEIPIKQTIAAIGFVENGWNFDRIPFEMSHVTDKDSITLTVKPASATSFTSKLKIITKDKEGKDQEVDDDRFELLSRSSVVVITPKTENLSNEPIKSTLYVQNDTNKLMKDKLVIAVIEVVQNPLPVGGIAGWTIPESIAWTGTEADSTKKAITIVAPSNDTLTFKLVGGGFGIATKLNPFYSWETGKEIIAKGELPVVTTGTDLELWNLTEQPEKEVEAYLLIFHKVKEKDAEGKDIEVDKAVGKVKLIIAKKP